MFLQLKLTSKTILYISLLAACSGSLWAAAYGGGGHEERKAGVPLCSISGVIREDMASVPLQVIHRGGITLVMCRRSEKSRRRRL